MARGDIWLTWWNLSWRSWEFVSVGNLCEISGLNKNWSKVLDGLKLRLSALTTKTLKFLKFPPNWFDPETLATTKNFNFPKKFSSANQKIIIPQKDIICKHQKFLIRNAKVFHPKRFYKRPKKPKNLDQKVTSHKFS